VFLASTLQAKIGNTWTNLVLFPPQFTTNTILFISLFTENNINNILVISVIKYLHKIIYKIIRERDFSLLAYFLIWRKT